MTAVGLAGCGSGSGDTTASAAAKAAFLKQVAATCEKSYNRIKSDYLTFVEGTEGKRFSGQKVRQYANTILIPAKRQEVKELRALGAPSGDEDAMQAIVEAFEEGIERAEEDPHAAVSSAFGVFGKATELTKEYGLNQTCRT